MTRASSFFTFQASYYFRRALSIQSWLYRSYPRAHPLIQPKQATNGSELHFQVGGERRKYALTLALLWSFEESEATIHHLALTKAPMNMQSGVGATQREGAEEFNMAMWPMELRDFMAIYHRHPQGRDVELWLRHDWNKYGSFIPHFLSQVDYFGHELALIRMIPLEDILRFSKIKTPGCVTALEILMAFKKYLGVWPVIKLEKVHQTFRLKEIFIHFDAFTFIPNHPESFILMNACGSTYFDMKDYIIGADGCDENTLVYM